MSDPPLPIPKLNTSESLTSSYVVLPSLNSSQVSYPMPPNLKLPDPTNLSSLQSSIPRIPGNTPGGANNPQIPPNNFPILPTAGFPGPTNPSKGMQDPRSSVVSNPPVSNESVLKASYNGMKFPVPPQINNEPPQANNRLPGGNPIMQQFNPSENMIAQGRAEINNLFALPGPTNIDAPQTNRVIPPPNGLVSHTPSNQVVYPSPTTILPVPSNPQIPRIMPVPAGLPMPSNLPVPPPSMLAPTNNNTPLTQNSIVPPYKAMQSDLPNTSNMPIAPNLPIPSTNTQIYPNPTGVSPFQGPKSPQKFPVPTAVPPRTQDPLPVKQAPDTSSISSNSSVASPMLNGVNRFQAFPVPSPNRNSLFSKDSHSSISSSDVSIPISDFYQQRNSNILPPMPLIPSRASLPNDLSAQEKYIQANHLIPQTRPGSAYQNPGPGMPAPPNQGPRPGTSAAVNQPYPQAMPIPPNRGLPVPAPHPYIPGVPIPPNQSFNPPNPAFPPPQAFTQVIPPQAFPQPPSHYKPPNVPLPQNTSYIPPTSQNPVPQNPYNLPIPPVPGIQNAAFTQHPGFIPPVPQSSAFNPHLPFPPGQSYWQSPLVPSSQASNQSISLSSSESSISIRRVAMDKDALSAHYQDGTLLRIQNSFPDTKMVFDNAGPDQYCVRINGPPHSVNRAAECVQRLDSSPDTTWYFLDNLGQFEAYPARFSALLENAHNEGRDSITFDLNGGVNQGLGNRNDVTVVFGNNGNPHTQRLHRGFINRTVRRGREPIENNFRQNDVVWYWSDDAGGRWMNYEAEACRSIEYYYNKFLEEFKGNSRFGNMNQEERKVKAKKVSVLVWGTSAFSYMIDFINMVQINEKTQRWRGIRRVNHQGNFRVSENLEDPEPVPWLPHPDLD